MGLNDLISYYELYHDVKAAGKDTLLNDELLKKEKEFINKSITLKGVVNEINFKKNEIIVTYTDMGSLSEQIQKLISNHFFVFAISGNMELLLKNIDIEKDDLVEISGTLISLHRQSAMRIILSSASIVQKKYGIIPYRDRKGCFIATAVYGSHESSEVQKFYTLRDNILEPSFLGRLFIKFYYRVSPSLAKWIDDKPATKTFLRKNVLDRILRKFKL